MKILFINRSSLYFFYTKSVLESFLQNGHELIALYEKDPKWIGAERGAAFRESLKKWERASFGLSFWRTDGWKVPLYYTRMMLSYRRFLVSRNQILTYQNKFLKILPFPARMLFKNPFLGRAATAVLKSSFGGGALRLVEKISGVDRTILDQIKKYKPDIVMISIGGFQYGCFDIDYIKAASALGIPNAALVTTWDSLINKSLLQTVPDRLLVWNELQASAAINDHGVPRKNINIIGAPVFDRWFGGLKATPREEFCKVNGLNFADPILLYLGSPPSNVDDETWLLKELRESLDQSEDKKLQRAQIIMRPHPSNAQVYKDLNIDKVTILPRGGEHPDEGKALQLFYDSLYHSAAATGVNTSAFIESIIVGRPIIALITEKYKATQSEIPHFRYMLDGGAVEIAEGAKGVVASFGKIVGGEDTRKDARLQFIKKFIRPAGLNCSAGDSVLNEIKDLVENYGKNNVSA